MSKGIPVNLPSIQFSKKSDATDFFREMLNRYSDGDDVNSEDAEILYELILRHPETVEKLGVGLNKFYRARSTEYPATSCFHIERTDGTTTDFSYKSCIDSTEPTLDDYFYRACSWSVYEKNQNEKKQLFTRGPVHCSKTNEVVTLQNSEYRHTSPSLKALVEEYKSGLGAQLTSEMFVEHADLQYSFKFADQTIEQGFIDLHNQKAKLAIFKK
jgi:hypothetical protein